MTVATVDELFARNRRDDRTALVDATGREFDTHWLCTTSWKAGNYLRHSGVREGVTVGVVGEGPLALLACFGTTLLEGATRFDPPLDLSEEREFQALVAPEDRIDAYELPPGARRVCYGDDHDDPDVAHFDEGLWSENPSFPPLSIDPETAIVDDGTRTLSHRAVLESARDVIDERGLEPGDRIVVREPLPDTGAVIAGVIAPLLSDGVIVLTDGSDGSADAEERGDVAVSSESAPEPARIDPATVGC